MTKFIIYMIHFCFQIIPDYQLLFLKIPKISRFFFKIFQFPGFLASKLSNSGFVTTVIFKININISSKQTDNTLKYTYYSTKKL